MVEPRKSRTKQQTAAAPLTREKRGAPESKQTEQFVLTLDRETHDVVEAVRVELSGRRRRLSEQECLALIGDVAVDEVMRGMEEAFEAGMAAGLLLHPLLRNRLSHSQTATEQRRQPISDHPRNGSNSNH
jgi:hypothetical protein